MHGDGDIETYRLRHRRSDRYRDGDRDRDRETGRHGDMEIER